jgi:hypothetical protein
MTKKQRKRVEQLRDQEKDVETLEKEQQERADFKKRTASLRRLESAPRPKHPKIWVMMFTLAMALVCGLYGSQHYYRNDRLFLLILNAIVAAVGSGFLAYCWKKRITYSGLFLRGATGAWIYRDGDPFFYWVYMAFYLCIEAATIYLLFYVLIKGSI